MEYKTPGVRRLEKECEYHSLCAAQYRDSAARLAMSAKMKRRALDNAAYHDAKLVLLKEKGWAK